MRLIAGRYPCRRRACAVDLHALEQYRIGPRSPIRVGRPQHSHVGGRFGLGAFPVLDNLPTALDSYGLDFLDNRLGDISLTMASNWYGDTVAHPIRSVPSYESARLTLADAPCSWLDAARRAHG